MKKTHLVTPLLVGAMLMPAALSAPSAHAVEPTATISATSTHDLSASDARNSIQLLNARITTLQSVQKSAPGSDYSDQIRDLLKAALLAGQAFVVVGLGHREEIGLVRIDLGLGLVLGAREGGALHRLGAQIVQRLHAAFPG